MKRIKIEVFHIHGHVQSFSYEATDDMKALNDHATEGLCYSLGENRSVCFYMDVDGKVRRSVNLNTAVDAIVSVIELD